MLTHLDSSSLTALDLISSDWSLCCPVSTALSIVHRQLPSLSSFFQLSSRVLLPTSGHAEISSPKPFVWFRAKTDKGIVCLADLLHSVTKVSIHEVFLMLRNKNHKTLYIKQGDYQIKTDKCTSQNFIL